MADDSGAHAKWLGDAFRSVDWLIPAYLSIGFLRGLAAVINNAEPEQKPVVFKAILRLVYTPKYIASLFMYRYKVTDFVGDFSVHIDESIRAYYSGFRHVAISSMIPVIEGIVRKVAIANGRDVGLGTAGLLREFEALVEFEASSPNRFEERLVMLEMLRDFMRDRFLKNTNRFEGLNQFNRHGILHGVFDDFGEEINFLRIITLLDLMCFTINLRFPRASFLAPGSTSASDALAAEYIAHFPVVSSREPEISIQAMKIFLETVGH